MKIALHFNADHEMFPGFYSYPIYFEIFKVLLNHRNLNISSKMFVGDLLFLLYSREEITEETIENIDIGGPSLIRAGAKNYNYVSVLTDPNQYEDFIDNLKNGEISIDKRKELAAEAFSHTSKYDTVISNHWKIYLIYRKKLLELILKKTAGCGTEKILTNQLQFMAALKIILKYSMEKRFHTIILLI